MADSCNDFIDVATQESRQRRVLLAALAINLIAFAVMVTGSYLSGSSALLSGTLDNLGDALTYALSFAVVGAGARPKAMIALLKGGLILAAALGVALHIGWRLANPEAPLAEVMGVAAALNLAANGVCFWMLMPLRHQDVNMASVWECSRNDLLDGVAVIVAAALVWWFEAGWPDLLVAVVLLLFFLRSALRVLRSALAELRTVGQAA